jgi:beta-phosphoglucomutase-like phosphatase (HAD superfamily)
VEAVLKASGLLQHFEFIVAKEDVTAPKPDPEGYRLALAKLDLPPSEVVALEDSPTGLAAAKAAGLRVIAVGHRRPQGKWSEEAMFVADLADSNVILAAIG